MNYIHHTRAAHEHLQPQPAARPHHVSLYWALFFEWNAARFPAGLDLDHAATMQAARIGSRHDLPRRPLRPRHLGPARLPAQPVPARAQPLLPHRFIGARSGPGKRRYQGHKWPPIKTAYRGQKWPKHLGQKWPR